MTRTDIRMKDVFISWTGKDREIKNQIVSYLNANGISCLESDESCSGDFRQWSHEAVGACHVFLVILTEHTIESQYVPIEIEELKSLDDWSNRVVPVVESMELYRAYSWGLSESESAVMWGENTEECMRCILQKVTDLLIHRQYTVFCEQSKNEYLKLMPLYGVNKAVTSQHTYDNLYIRRILTEVTEDGEKMGTLYSPEGFLHGGEIVLISGTAGSGKTQYIHEIKEHADEKMLVITLSCSKISSSKEELFEMLYLEFQRICGNRSFYSRENFKRLLDVKHLVLILDGMDEIATRIGTECFISKTEKFYKVNNERMTLIFTSRNPEDANSIVLAGKNVRKLVLNQLSEEDTKQLGENLFLAFGSVEKKDDFYLRIKDLDEEIKANPLLLSQLAIVYQNTGDVPKTIIGIYDAIFNITLKVDSMKELEEIPESYRDMVQRKLGAVLKAFSRERYNLLSQGKNKESLKIFSTVLKRMYGEECRERAAFLEEYLQNRAILLDGEFYHKMFLEYFTAVDFYEHCFDDYDEIENEDVLEELFLHYDDSYWSAVIQLFLIKADVCLEESIERELYEKILSAGKILDYTLLFDVCHDLAYKKETVQLVLVHDILNKSVRKVYPPYGPLFWYVPKYGLYESAILAAEKMSGSAEALALVRDVCYIFGQKNTVAEVTERVNGERLYRAAQNDLNGVRSALCELFYIGETSFDGGADIYPRCFNVEEAKSFFENDHGLIKRVNTPFEDELHLYEHESYNELNGEMIGLVSCPYDKSMMEKNFTIDKMQKVSGLALFPTDTLTVKYIAIYRKNLKVIYFPENCSCAQKDFNFHLDLIYIPFLTKEYLMYVKKSDTFILPGTIKNVEGYAFKTFRHMNRLVISEGVERLHKNAFIQCTKKLHILELPDSVEQIVFTEKMLSRLEKIIISQDKVDFYKKCMRMNLWRRYVKKVITNEKTGKAEVIMVSAMTEEISFDFEALKEQKNIILPKEMVTIPAFAFHNFSELAFIRLPYDVKEIGESALEGCCSLTKVYLPDGLVKIGKAAFKNCTALEQIYFPEGVLKIEEQTFENCTNLKRVYLPETIEYVDPTAFRGCQALRHIKKSPRLILDGYFPDTVRIEEYEADYYWRNMMEWLLANIGEIRGTDYTKIERAKINAGIKVLPERQFAECRKLTCVTLNKSVKKIERECFINCVKLKNVHAARKVWFIGEKAFAGCSSLEEFTFSKTLTTISRGAFEGCTSLKQVMLPVGVKEIEADAFKGCTNLTYVEISANFRSEISRIFGEINRDIIHYI